MTRVLLTTAIILIQFFSFSQSLKGVVIDELDSPIERVNIVNNTRNTGVTSNSNGEFLIKASAGDLISFSYVGKKSEFYKVKVSDTNFILITLKEDISKLKEFSVSGSRIKKVCAEKNENIIDYLSLGKNTLLVLKRRNYDYQLTIEGVDTVYKTYPIDEYKPKELYVDFNKNIHIICKDSIRQIHFDSTLQVVSAISESKFETFIMPTIYKYDSSLLVYNYTSHNKRYTLIKETIYDRKIVYQSFDSVRSKFNDHYVWINIAGKPEISKGENLNSAMLQIARQLHNDAHFFEAILCRKLFVRTFVVNKTTVVFDLFSDSLFGYNQQGNLLKSISLKEIKALNPKEIIQNKENPSLFYAVTEAEGIFSFHTLNLLSGKVSNTFTLDEFNFPKNIQIINNWIYFMRPNRANYHKLYRINMDEKKF